MATYTLNTHPPTTCPLCSTEINEDAGVAVDLGLGAVWYHLYCATMEFDIRFTRG